MASILVIDDEVQVRFAMRAVLEDAGHQVQEAATGTDGLAALRAGTFDLVICDIIMPDKEGIETIEDIRAMLPQQPVIAISGGGRIRKEDYLAVAAAVGASQTIAKPFTAETLLTTVNAVLRP